MATPVEVTDDLLAAMPLPPLAEDAGKDERGGLLVIGGSPETPGAVLLAALAAIRVGAGRLRLAVPEPIAVPLAISVPEARVVGLRRWDAETLADLARSVRAVLVGPGILDASALEEALSAMGDAGPETLVVDAGALPGLPHARLGRAQVLATPNPRELSSLGGEDPAEVAARLAVTVACRGAATTVATPAGQTWVDRSGGVGLATSGSGDVAVGAIAGLAARGAPPHVAAVWGARLHGLAGDALAQRVGPVGFLARELLDELPRVLARLTRS